MAKKDPQTRGCLRQLKTMRRPLGEKRVLYGKIIGENILRSMLAIKLLYCLAPIYYFLIIAFIQLFFNSQNRQKFYVETSYFAQKVKTYAVPNRPARKADSISTAGIVAILAMVDRAK